MTQKTKTSCSFVSPSPFFEDENLSRFSILLTEVLLFSFTFSSLCSYFLIILFKCSQIFTSLRELTFFHALSYVPVDKRTLCVHKVKFVVNARQSFSDCCRVRNHTTCSHDTCQ